MNNTVHILCTSVVVIESFACTSITSTYVAMRQFTSKLPLLVWIRRRIMHANQLEVDVLLPARLLNILANLYPDEAEALPPVSICSWVGGWTAVSSFSGSSFKSGRGPVALGPPWVTILLLSSSTRAFCSALFNPYNKEATLKPLSYNCFERHNPFRRYQ